VTAPPETVGLMAETAPGPGVLHELTGVLARHRADIQLVEIVETRPDRSRIYFEAALDAPVEALSRDLEALPVVRSLAVVKTFQRIYGKRIIIMGGGAQVGQVALGAISEADRHNIRGEHISVDTIPLVGEQTLADAVRAIRAQGVIVISLNMAGSVPASADLVVTDPVQAGVMAVMAVAETASFSLERLSRRIF